MSSILECALEAFCSCLYWCCMEVCCSERSDAPQPIGTKQNGAESESHGQPIFEDAIGVSKESSFSIRENDDQYNDRVYGIR